MPSPFIPDGYTKDATIEVNGFDPVQITYRPMLRGDADRLLWGAHGARQRGEDGPLQYWEKLTCDSVAKQIVSWSLLDQNGKPVRISGDAVSRLKGPFFNELYNKVAGYADEEADAKN